MQTTLAIIKPDAADKEDEIAWRIQREGFSVKMRRRITLTKEQAGEFYQEHVGKPFYAELVKFMTSGPIVVLALQKFHAIEEWRKLIGPTNSHKARETAPESLRALYGTDNTRNACHGSDSPKSADREVLFFFGGVTSPSVPLISPSDAGTSPAASDQSRLILEREVYPTLTKGLTQLAKEKPANPTQWLGRWLLANNPNQPRMEEPPK
ncbi:nucleoside diphosphate kinase [Gonapodya prolifera JEL478]|uniref:Nucleoside diphosphate kinase n=1 Tax=Gonapodya prolifera (strain JEL478) TaxID=1344416 RepID=A0A139AB19_GONPJ|nr:nucleoside diphosphate kinase [Gonapodya prolifera JEL478]|eukprot:KXS13864.1 nucleoside diphosphate kinase [Gonapodya prolifera JEL478]